MPGAMSGSHITGSGGPMPVNHPGSNPPAGFSMEMMQKRQMLMRQQLQPQRMPSGPGGPMYPHGMQGSSAQTAALHHLPPQGMTQGYGNYSGSGIPPNANMMESRNSSMLSSNFNQSYGAQQTASGMMGPNSIRNQQSQYMPQPNRSQYSMGAPNVTVNQMGGGPHLSGSQMVQNSGNTYGGQSNPQAMSAGGTSNQMHMQQICHQQQIMAMQQKNQQQQRQQQQQALVAHLQHINTNSQGPPHPQQQQHHPYHPQGPY